VYPVQAVDTTGAGDMYAAGLLYGLSQGSATDVSGRIASYAAAQVVAKLGPRLETIDLPKSSRSKWDAIRGGRTWLRRQQEGGYCVLFLHSNFPATAT